MEANILAAYYSSSMGEGFVRYDEDPIPVSLEYESNDLEYQDMYIHIKTDNVSTDETVKKYYAYRGKILGTGSKRRTDQGFLLQIGQWIL